MKAITLLAAAGAMALAPASAVAVPGNSHGPTNGAGWNHLHGPDEGQTGQKFLECGEDGPTPGHAGQAPGGGSAFVEGGNAGSHYAEFAQHGIGVAIRHGLREPAPLSRLARPSK